jgi:hypothetical protein
MIANIAQLTISECDTVGRFKSNVCGLGAKRNAFFYLEKDRKIVKKYKFRKNAEIGKLEAETDSYLDFCFYKSDVYKGLLDFDSSEGNPDFTRRIIVGRTGSGKTALLKQIINDSAIKVHEVIEAENTVFEHIKNNVFIMELISKGIDLRVFYKSLWLHVLLINVINQVHRSSYESFFDKVASFIPMGKKSYNAKLANEYVEKFKDNFFNDNVIEEITNRIQDELSSKLGMSKSGIKSQNSEENTRKIQRETSSYVSKELIRKQKELIKLLKIEFSNEKQVKIVISIDDLDKSWLSSSEIRYDFINALLEAFRELLDIKSVKILISIRTDIIMGIYENNLRQEEKDESLIYAISWNRKEIKEILNKRINYLVKNQYSSSANVTMEDVFSFDVQGHPATDYIIDRTMLRPRDAISFVNQCLSQCDGDVFIDENIVLTAEEKFYALRKKALAKEWLSIYPHVQDYLDALSFLKHDRFSLESLCDSEKDGCLNYLLSKSYNYNDPVHNNRILEFNELMKVWFTIGVIGISKTEDIQIYSSFEKPTLDITDLNRKFLIHPLFYRAIK